MGGGSAARVGDFVTKIEASWLKLGASGARIQGRWGHNLGHLGQDWWPRLVAKIGVKNWGLWGKGWGFLEPRYEAPGPQAGLWCRVLGIGLFWAIYD